MVTTRSAPVGRAAFTVDVAVAALLAAGSGVVVATRAVSAIAVPAGVPGATRTTSVKVAVAAAGRFGTVAETAPVAPTAGVVAVQPEGVARETNVVRAGRASS